MSDTIQTSAVVQTRGRGVKENSSPGAPGGAPGVEADAGRGAGVDARRCTVQRGARGAERKKVLACAPCLCPSFSPPVCVIAVGLSVGPRPGRSGRDYQDRIQAISEKEVIKKKMGGNSAWSVAAVGGRCRPSACLHFCPRRPCHCVCHHRGQRDLWS